MFSVQQTGRTLLRITILSDSTMRECQMQQLRVTLKFAKKPVPTAFYPSFCGDGPHAADQCANLGTVNLIHGFCCTGLEERVDLVAICKGQQCRAVHPLLTETPIVHEEKHRFYNIWVCIFDCGLAAGLLTHASCKHGVKHRGR